MGDIEHAAEMFGWTKEWEDKHDALNKSWLNILYPPPRSRQQ